MSKIQTATYSGPLPTSQRGRSLSEEALDLIEMLKAATQSPQKWVGAASENYSANRTKLKTYAKRAMVGFHALGAVGNDIVVSTFQVDEEGNAIETPPAAAEEATTAAKPTKAAPKRR